MGGALGDRFGVKRIIAVGLFATAVAVVLRAILPNFFGLTISMLLAGISFGFIAPNTGKAVGMWFGPTELGRVLGLTTVQGAASWIVALVSAAALSSLLGGWRNVMWLVVAIALIVGVMWTLFAKERTPTSSNPAMVRVPMREGLKQVMKIKDLWIICGMGACVMGAVLTNIGLMPGTMEARGMSASTSGIYLAIATAATAIFSLIGPGISDKIGLRKPFVWPFLLISASLVTLFGAFTGVPLLIVLVVYCVGVGTAMPLFRALILENEQVGYRLAGSAFGLFQTISGIGPMIMPYIMGAIMDATGQYWTGFLLPAILFSTGSILAFSIKETGIRAKQANQTGLQQ